MVVAFSVLVQGSTVPWAARKLGVRMRHARAGALAALDRPREGARRPASPPRAGGLPRGGPRIKELPLGEYGWILTIVRDGEVVRPGGSSVLEPGDEVVVSAESSDARGVRRLFEGSP